MHGEKAGGQRHRPRGFQHCVSRAFRLVRCCHPIRAPVPFSATHLAADTPFRVEFEAEITFAAKPTYSLPQLHQRGARPTKTPVSVSRT